MSDIKRKINSDLDDRMTLDWQGTRAFFYGLGYNDADIEKPRVGIMNTWNEINLVIFTSAIWPTPSGRASSSAADFRSCLWRQPVRLRGGGDYVLPSGTYWSMRLNSMPRHITWTPWFSSAPATRWFPPC